MLGTISGLRLCSLMIMKQSDDFEGFICQVRKANIPYLLSYARNVLSSFVSKSKEMFNIDNETLVAHSTTDGKIAEMVLQKSDYRQHSDHV